MINELKRITCLLLCLIFVGLLFVSCYEGENNDKEADIQVIENSVPDIQTTKEVEGCAGQASARAEQCGGYIQVSAYDVIGELYNCNWTAYELRGNDSCRDQICDQITYHHQSIDIYCSAGPGYGSYYLDTCDEVTGQTVNTIINDTECTQVLFNTPCEIPGQNISCCY